MSNYSEKNDIIILAMGATRIDCPFDVKEVWGVNTSYRQVYGMGGHPNLGGHLNKIFICHRGQEYDWTCDPVFDWNELKQMVEDKGIEIISMFDMKDLRKCGIPFTRMYYKTISKKFDTDYFSDTIAYQIAYAMHLNTIKDKKTGLLKLKEPMRIRMYGVDMHDYDGYATERGGVEYFVAIAKTLGVNFYIHPESVVCKTDTLQPYGFAKSVLKTIKANKVFELQKTPRGIRKLVKMGILDQLPADRMLAELKGFRATLREATDDDAKLAFEWRNKPEVYAGFYTQKVPLTIEEHLTWWQSRNKDWRIFVIMCQEKPIGIVNIGQLDHWSPEVGYYIGESDLWGKGLGIQAVAQALGYIKAQGKQHCHTTVLKSNTRSLSLLFKLGFEVLGEARKGEIWLQKSL